MHPLPDRRASGQKRDQSSMIRALVAMSRCQFSSTAAFVDGRDGWRSFAGCASRNRRQEPISVAVANSLANCRHPRARVRRGHTVRTRISADSEECAADSVQSHAANALARCPSRSRRGPSFEASSESGPEAPLPRVTPRLKRRSMRLAPRATRCADAPESWSHVQAEAFLGLSCAHIVCTRFSVRSFPALLSPA